MPTTSQDLFCKFTPGMCGRVRLRGASHVFEFACGRDNIILDSQISSPRLVFETLVEEVVSVDVQPVHS